MRFNHDGMDIEIFEGWCWGVGPAHVLGTEENEAKVLLHREDAERMQSLGRVPPLVLHIELARVEGFGPFEGMLAFRVLVPGLQAPMLLAAPREKWVDLASGIFALLGVDEREFLRGQHSIIIAQSMNELPPWQHIKPW